jgi:hypothetical protein
VKREFKYSPLVQLGYLWMGATVGAVCALAALRFDMHNLVLFVPTLVASYYILTRRICNDGGAYYASISRRAALRLAELRPEHVDYYSQQAANFASLIRSYWIEATLASIAYFVGPVGSLLEITWASVPTFALSIGAAFSVRGSVVCFAASEKAAKEWEEHAKFITEKGDA